MDSQLIADVIEKHMASLLYRNVCLSLYMNSGKLLGFLRGDVGHDLMTGSRKMKDMRLEICSWGYIASLKLDNFASLRIVLDNDVGSLLKKGLSPTKQGRHLVL